MATVLESLKGINAYPIPLRTLVDAAEYRGLDMTVEVSQEIMQTALYGECQEESNKPKSIYGYKGSRL